MTNSTGSSSESSLTPNMEFSKLASEEQIQRTVNALETNGIHAVVVDTGEEAKRKVLELLPEGSEVFTSTSRTLDSIGLSAEIDNSAHYQSVRSRLGQLNWETQGNEMRKLGASPDIIVGSVHAVTEQGQVLIASATGSQLGPYVYGAGQVVWVVGTQKIVPNLEKGMQRIYEYSYPLEDARARQVYGMPSSVGKILIVNREAKPGRIAVVLVKQNLGF